MRISKCVINDNGRECAKCGKYQSWDNYYKNKNFSRGRLSRCKTCQNNQVKDYYYDNKDKCMKAIRKSLLKHPLNVPGVYLIYSDKGKYVGQSKTMYSRACTHKSKGSKLSAVRLAGVKVLSWEVLEYVDNPELRLQRESYWINKLKPELNTYIVSNDR